MSCEVEPSASRQQARWLRRDACRRQPRLPQYNLTQSGRDQARFQTMEPPQCIVRSAFGLVNDKLRHSRRQGLQDSGDFHPREMHPCAHVRALPKAHMVSGPARNVEPVRFGITTGIAIVEGRQPPSLDARALLAADLPLNWQGQRAALAFEQA